MWAGACAGELLERRGGLECSDLAYLRSALDGKRGALVRQPTKHVRTHTHNPKPLNHFIVVPHPLSPLRFNIPTICRPKGYIQLLNGCQVPILRRDKTVSYARADQPGKSGANSEADAKMLLGREVALPLRSRGYVPVQKIFRGNGVITQRHRVYERHRVNVATCTMDCIANQTWWVEVTHTGNTSKQLPKGMVLGHMSASSGTVAAISQEYWAALSPSPATAPDATDPVKVPHVLTSNVPEGLRPRVLALLEKHRALWSWHLGSIKATEHRIEWKPGSEPVLYNPYRMDPRSMELIKAQVDQKLKLEVIDPRQSEWPARWYSFRNPTGVPGSASTNGI